MIIEVYESNAGTLHMHDGIRLVSGFERQDPGTLVGDITSWDVWVDDATVIQPFEPGLIDGMKLIATYVDGTELTLFVDRMGRAGERYAGITF